MLHTNLHPSLELSHEGVKLYKQLTMSLTIIIIFTCAYNYFDNISHIIIMLLMLRCAHTFSKYICYSVHNRTVLYHVGSSSMCMD